MSGQPGPAAAQPRQPDPTRWIAERVSAGHVADYKPFVMVDGPGVRCSLYLSGCLFACPGCFNEAAWSFRYGHPYSQDLEDRIIDDLRHEYVRGLSLAGGEPFLNTGVALQIVRRVRAEFGHSRDIWCWSGYTWEQLLEDSADKRQLVAELDVLVDGPYLAAERDLSLAFRGSRNQRLVDVPGSLATGTLVQRPDPVSRM